MASAHLENALPKKRGRWWSVFTTSGTARATAAKAGIEIIGLHWLLVGPQGLHLTHPDPDVRRNTAAYFRDLVNLCADLGGRVLLPALLGEGVHRLDALVMTHPDRDHCGGLVDIAAYLTVREVWSAPGWEPQGCAGRLLSLPGVRHRFLSRGQRLKLGRWRLAVLHPEPEGHRATNERSLVLLAAVHGRRALLTGDIERQSEHELADCCSPELRTDVLKVAHHGSRTSSTPTFLEAATPRLALISAGVRNVYHHPSPEVVTRLQEGGARVLRTDRSGEILLSFGADGKIRITTPGAPK